MATVYFDSAESRDNVLTGENGVTLHPLLLKHGCPIKFLGHDTLCTDHYETANPGKAVNQTRRHRVAKQEKRSGCILHPGEETKLFDNPLVSLCLSGK
jgi:hypothetical protein